MKSNSPLPWRYGVTTSSIESGNRWIVGSDQKIVITTDASNAAYIVHACNLYPKLAEMLRKLQPKPEAKCPVCRPVNDWGHKPDCELAALLKEIDA